MADCSTDTWRTAGEPEDVKSNRLAVDEREVAGLVSRWQMIEDDKLFYHYKTF